MNIIVKTSLGLVLIASALPTCALEGGPARDCLLKASQENGISDCMNEKDFRTEFVKPPHEGVSKQNPAPMIHPNNPSDTKTGMVDVATPISEGSRPSQNKGFGEKFGEGFGSVLSSVFGGVYETICNKLQLPIHPNPITHWPAIIPAVFLTACSIPVAIFSGLFKGFGIGD